jgi:hypothetical protein
MTIRGIVASILSRLSLRPANNPEGRSADTPANGDLILAATGDLTGAIQEHIPPYLTLEQKEALASALSRFPNEKEYYLSGLYVDEMLQGDGWTNLQIFRFETGDRKKVTGIILSNSCDISPENKREIPPSVVFSPVIKLSKYTSLLENSGLEPAKIKAKIEAIKKQAVTTIFYLPDAVGGLGDEYIAILDNVHTIPSSAIKIGWENKKGFTLNTLGFYMFIFKLSINFCRLREDVVRAA